MRKMIFIKILLLPLSFLFPSRSVHVSVGKLALISMIFGGFFLFTSAYNFAGGGNHFLDWALAIVKGETLPPTIAQRDVGFPLLLILGGFPIWHSFIGISIIQTIFGISMPLLVYWALLRASPTIAYYAGLATILSLAPYTYEKWIYHDQGYIFFTLLSAALLIEFVARKRWWAIIGFTLAILMASVTRPAGNVIFPLLLVVTYVFVRGPLRFYAASILIFALGVGAYAWHRYEIFDVRHQTKFPGGAGMQLGYAFYVNLSGFGLSLSPDIGPATKQLLADLREKLGPEPRKSALLDVVRPTEPPEFSEKYIDAFTTDELIKRISENSTDDYFWILYFTEADNDQFYLEVAKEIALAHPLYIARYAARNLWHALFDPGYGITRYNVAGYGKTGNDFIPGFNGETRFLEESATGYGKHLVRELQYFPINDAPVIIEEIFTTIEEYWDEYFHIFVNGTSALIVVAWVGVFLWIGYWLRCRLRSDQQMVERWPHEVIGPITIISAMLLYENTLIAVFAHPFYRYFHFTELYRLILAGFGAVLIRDFGRLVRTRIGSAVRGPDNDSITVATRAGPGEGEQA